MKGKDDMNAPQTMEEYGALLQERGVKPTAMRLLVYRELCKADRPLSLKDMEERMVTADRSTIFRALTLLLGHHLVHGLEDGSGALKGEMHSRGQASAFPLHRLPEDLLPVWHCHPGRCVARGLHDGLCQLRHQGGLPRLLCCLLQDGRQVGLFRT